jgi:hypothetical protein
MWDQIQEQDPQDRNPARSCDPYYDLAGQRTSIQTGVTAIHKPTKCSRAATFRGQHLNNTSLYDMATPREAPRQHLTRGSSGGAELGNGWYGVRREDDTIRGGACGGWRCTLGWPPRPCEGRGRASSPTSPTAAFRPSPRLGSMEAAARGGKP